MPYLGRAGLPLGQEHDDVLVLEPSRSVADDILRVDARGGGGRGRSCARGAGRTAADARLAVLGVRDVCDPVATAVRYVVGVVHL